MYIMKADRSYNKVVCCNFVVDLNNKLVKITFYIGYWNSFRGKSNKLCILTTRAEEADHGRTKNL